jgi:hypothetical protein
MDVRRNKWLLSLFFGLLEKMPASHSATDMKAYKQKAAINSDKSVSSKIQGPFP